LRRPINFANPLLSPSSPSANIEFLEEVLEEWDFKRGSCVTDYESSAYVFSCKIATQDTIQAKHTSVTATVTKCTSARETESKHTSTRRTSVTAANQQDQAETVEMEAKSEQDHVVSVTLAGVPAENYTDRFGYVMAFLV
ncbi:hypothetical protein BC938DRAFT_473699, partial [Jimgerdemannia flammicorona]